MHTAQYDYSAPRKDEQINKWYGLAITVTYSAGGGGHIFLYSPF
jgi:hypothetical protein